MAARKQSEQERARARAEKEEASRKKKEEALKRKEEKKKMNPAGFTFPWWCKPLAYIMSFSIAGVSFFFIVIKGIALGDEAVGQWLSSIVTSFISGVCLTQPIQVIIFKTIS
jgi:hypothetical protein